VELANARASIRVRLAGRAMACVSAGKLPPALLELG